MYRRISVPLDGTTHSQQALRWAVPIARRANCPVEIVHVVAPPALGTEIYGVGAVQGPDLEELRHDAERQLRAVAEEVEALGVQVVSTLLDGAVPKALADHLGTGVTDLVVMTTHDRGRLEHLLLGSVAESVVRRLHLPMLLVRGHDEVEPLPTPATIAHMLVPLDGSAFADEVLPHAMELASLMGAAVTLLGVVQPVLAAAALAPPISAASALLTSNPSADGDQRDIDSAALEQTAERLRETGIPIDTHALSNGQPARAIVDYAKAHTVDTIAMTTHGRGAFERLVAGSVSQKVLRSWDQATLMYRPQDR